MTGRGAGRYVLYGRRNTGSAAVEAALAEAGLEHELVDLEPLPDGSPDPRLLALNPLGQVPVLALPSGEVMTESCAILLHLAERHPQAGLAPAPDAPERPAFLRWLVFLAASTYDADLRYYSPARFTTDPAGAAAVREAGARDMARDFTLLAAALGGGPWMLGGTWSVLDLYLGMIVSWAVDVPELFRRHPNLADHYARLTARPCAAAVWRRHGMPL